MISNNHSLASSRWQFPLWASSLFLHLVALGILALLTYQNDKSTDFLSRHFSDLPNISAKTAREQLQKTGRLSDVRLTEQLDLGSFNFGDQDVLIENVHFAAFVLFPGIQANSLRLVGCQFDSELSLDVMRLKRHLTIWRCSVGGELGLVNFPAEAAVTLNFKRPPVAILAGSRAEAERLHLHAPTVPLTWPSKMGTQSSPSKDG